MTQSVTLGGKFLKKGDSAPAFSLMSTKLITAPDTSPCLTMGCTEYNTGRGRQNP